jgi:methionyl-tRNA formyltransferase
MRTVYLGTSDFAVTVLERLVATPHRPVHVVTRPGPRGRGRRVGSPPVAEAAERLGGRALPTGQREDDWARARIADAEPEVVCICAFGALLKEPFLSQHEMLNVHPSLLQRWRGAVPVDRAIEAGDEETGVTIMRPTRDFDAGPVCLQRARSRSGPTTTTAAWQADSRSWAQRFWWRRSTPGLPVASKRRIASPMRASSSARSADSIPSGGPTSWNAGSGR